MSCITVIIPSRNELHLKQTIDNVLDSCYNPSNINIHVILDGWDFEPSSKRPNLEKEKQVYGWVKDQTRLKVTENKRAVGQRILINKAYNEADSEWVLKIDAHSILSMGWDKALIEGDREAINVPSVCRVDADKWQCKYDQIYTHAYIVNPTSKENALQSRRCGSGCGSETMSLLGMTWFTTKQFWDEIKHEEHLGAWGYSGTELALKAWLKGYKVLNHNSILCGHVFRGKFPYYAGNFQMKKTSEWIKDNLINGNNQRSFDWLVEKFKPKGYENA